MLSKVVKFLMPVFRRLMSFEQSLSRLPNAILPDSLAPKRFEIPLEAMNRIAKGEMPIGSLRSRLGMVRKRGVSLMKNMRESVRSVSDNPSTPKTTASRNFLQRLTKSANSIGVSPFGFVKFPRRFIFQGMGVAYDNAIVLAMEMDQERIAMAPSSETLHMIMNTYDDLGIAANRIADFLKSNGYGAQAGHPLGGILLYPPLAQMAGIGWLGRHGLIITPEFGSRVRLAAVLTSIQNLPIAERNEHSWIAEFCDACNQCVRDCPTGAILERPVEHENGLVTQIVNEKCFPYFMEYYGCTVCVKVCPFSYKSYSEIKKSFLG